MYTGHLHAIISALLHLLKIHLLPELPRRVGAFVHEGAARP